MTVRQALIFAFLLSDVMLYLILRGWRADHPADGQRPRRRITIYDAPQSTEDR